MKTFNNQAAQGDILLRKIDKIPKNAVPMSAMNGQYIVAHSETGHHHVVPDQDCTVFHAANDDMIMYLVANNEITLKHLRAFDTHAPIKIGKGNYEIRRQREYTPEGWVRVAD